MRKLLFALLCLLPLLSLADDFIIDETKSDIYFANSILMTQDKTKAYLDKNISKKICDDLYNGNFAKMKKELNFGINYNQTHGYYGDWYDTYMMLSSEEDGWQTLNKIMSYAMDKGLGKGVDKLAKLAKMTKKQKELLDKFMNAIDLSEILDIYKLDRTVDLSRQVAKLRDSIRHGHGVIVLAHGKGDIFTAKAYEEMLKPDTLDGVEYRDNGWMKEYFQWMSIGSPSRERSQDQPHVGFDNDSFAALGILSTIDNPNRSQFENGAGEVADENEIEFHDFRYYMGEPIHIVDDYKDTDVSTDVAKNIIMDFIKNAINKHKTAQSQWAVDEEFEKGTREYRVTVKHIYKDAPLNNIMKDQKIFPFNPQNKLYQVADTAGNLHYVKASFGGERILDAERDSAIWEAKENEFYKLEGTDPVEYILKESNNIRFHIFYVYYIEKHNINGTPYGTKKYFSSPDTVCSRSLSGSVGQTHFPDYHILTEEEGLASVTYRRNENEKYWYTTFPVIYQSDIKNAIECVLDAYGYTLGEVSKITHGDESRYFKQGTLETVREFELDQEYILYLK